MRVLLVVLGVIGGTLLLAIAMPFAIWLGADLLPQRTQPVTELTVKLDESGVPGIAARSLFAAVRDGLREPRIGFASMSPSDDSIDVALSEQELAERLSSYSPPRHDGDHLEIAIRKYARLVGSAAEGAVAR